MSKKAQPQKPRILLIDTSVFLNLLKVPGRNQDEEAVFSRFEKEIKDGTQFFLPYGAVIETGRFIAQIPGKGGQRKRKFAELFVARLKDIVVGKAPWKILEFPEKEEFIDWLKDFPDNCQAGKSFTDHTIIKDFDKICEAYPRHHVEIWTLDSTDLGGYLRPYPHIPTTT